MTRPFFDLLDESEGQKASISGHTDGRCNGARPEIIIPRPGAAESKDRPERSRKLEVGARVRIVRAPYAGSLGTIVDLPRHTRRVETGARARCAEVDIGREEPVSVPLVNLDILR
jgi:hypothetical protein